MRFPNSICVVEEQLPAYHLAGALRAIVVRLLKEKQPPGEVSYRMCIYMYSRHAGYNDGRTVCDAAEHQPRLLVLCGTLHPTSGISRTNVFTLLGIAFPWPGRTRGNVTTVILIRSLISARLLSQRMNSLTTCHPSAGTGECSRSWKPTAIFDCGDPLPSRTTRSRHLHKL